MEGMALLLAFWSTTLCLKPLLTSGFCFAHVR
jgi:hypothetical protein